MGRSEGSGIFFGGGWNWKLKKGVMGCYKRGVRRRREGKGREGSTTRG